eukprot:Pgem_evm6s9439
MIAVGQSKLHEKEYRKFLKSKFEREKYPHQSLGKVSWQSANHGSQGFYSHTPNGGGNGGNFKMTKPLAAKVK